MTDNYRLETEHFIQSFSKLKKQKIVLYGIGRYTAALLPGIPDFNIIGLMDRDEDNIGKTFYGRPVLSPEEAEEKADIVIINTVDSYWNVIYERIKDLKIPVYFRSGERAEPRGGKDCGSDPYWDSDMRSLKLQIDRHQVISFDIFDTLIMRRVHLPADVFLLTERYLRAKWKRDTDFAVARLAAATRADEYCCTLDDIYEQLFLLMEGRLSREECREAKRTEIELEKRLAVPRRDMMECLSYAVEAGKEVYLLSDMYLESGIIRELFQGDPVLNGVKDLWISCEKKKSKHRGDLWREYKEKAVGDRPALHIGDHPEDDIRRAEEAGIHSFHVRKPSELLRQSALRELVPHICSPVDSLLAGMVAGSLLNSPFALNRCHGKPYFDKPSEFGYAVIAPVVLTFLLWLIRESGQRGITKLYFLARDGYLLMEDYLELCGGMEGEPAPEAVYLGISRRAAGVAAVRTEEDFAEALELPYVGTFREYMKDRFDIDVPKEDTCGDEMINAAGDREKIMKYMKPYGAALTEEVRRERENYKKYLGNLGFRPEKGAVVDLCYYGNCQYFLSKITGRELTGFYFAANLLESNKCKRNNTLAACFQADSDPAADNCRIFKKVLLIESILTAPYGMILKIDDAGNFVCDRKKKNQEHFETKREINDGVKHFIADYLELTRGFWGELGVSPRFADLLYGCFADDGMETSDELKECFWADNGLVQRREFAILK